MIRRSSPYSQASLHYHECCKTSHKAEAIWHLQTDHADIQMNPEMEEVALTSSIDTFDDFVDELAELLSIRPFVPFYTYLIYDDRDIYAEVLKRLRIAGKIV